MDDAAGAVAAGAGGNFRVSDESPMGRLAGMCLIELIPFEDGVTLRFDRGVMTIWNPVTTSVPLVALLHGTVTDVVETHGESTELRFGTLGSLTISLRDEDYIGPEAFSATLDGVHVVA